MPMRTTAQALRLIQSLWPPDSRVGYHNGFGDPNTNLWLSGSEARGSEPHRRVRRVSVWARVRDTGERVDPRAALWLPSRAAPSNLLNSGAVQLPRIGSVHSRAIDAGLVGQHPSRVSSRRHGPSPPKGAVRPDDSAIVPTPSLHSTNGLLIARSHRFEPSLTHASL